MHISDKELDAHIAQQRADADLDEDTADRWGALADKIAKENP